MEIKIVKSSISKEELREMAKEGFGNLVKAVVDIESGETQNKIREIIKNLVQ